jgi:hypothetical protein
MGDSSVGHLSNDKPYIESFKKRGFWQRRTVREGSSREKAQVAQRGKAATKEDGR